MVKCCFVPTASFNINIDTIILTERCIRNLITLEEQILAATHEDEQDLCETFFCKFGSHVNIGSIHFGGIYQWKLDFYKSTDNNDTSIEEDSRNALKEFVESGAIFELKANIEKQYKCKGLGNLQLEVDNIGGPSKAFTFGSWETELTINKQCWKLIDRGEKRNFVGIWELLKNHQERFRDVSFLEKYLFNAWVTHDQVTIDQYTLLVSIRKFCNDSRFYWNCKGYLKHIVEAKRDIQCKAKSLKIWYDVLEKPEMIQFMTAILDCLPESFLKSDIFSIKLYLMQIFLGGAENIKFEGKENIIRWINPSLTLKYVQNISTAYIITYFITEIRQNIMPNLECAGLDGNEGISTEYLSYKTRIDFSHSVKLVINTLENINNQSGVSFLKLMLLDLKYDNRSEVFNQYVSTKMVKRFIDRISDENKKFDFYEAQDKQIIGFYLLQLAALASEKEEDGISREKHFKTLLKDISLGSESQRFINSAFNHYILWERLKSTIQARLDGEDHPNKVNEIMLLSAFDSRFGRKVDPLQINKVEEKEFEGTKWQILVQLGLSSFYPGKITLSDVRKLCVNKVDRLQDVPWYFLNSILLLNYNGRNKLQFPNESTGGGNLGQFNQNNAGKIDIDELFQDEIYLYNPMDVVIAVFLCSGHFLKQLIAQRLYVCHISIPFLLPDITGEQPILQLWAIRGIVLGSECNENLAVNHPSPIVSFMRIGDLPISKSRILNSILSDQSHDIFFHRNLRNGKARKEISDGLIDATWFIPSTVCNCICETPAARGCEFKQVIMFLNLHGSCSNFEIQRNLICGISTVISIMLDIKQLENNAMIKCVRETVDLATNALVIFTNGENLPLVDFRENINTLIRSFGENVKILLAFNKNGKSIHFEELKERVKLNINMILSPKDLEVKSLIEQLEISKIPNIKIDEGGPSEKIGKTKASNIYEKMKQYDLSCIKERLLPLRGELWNKWGKSKREIKRGYSKETETQECFLANLCEEQYTLRWKQENEYTRESNEIMPGFIKNIIELQGDCRRYYIHWLNYFLCEISREKLIKLRRERSEKSSALMTAKQKRLESNEPISNLMCELEELEVKIEKASFGFKHFVREIGQIYEAFKSSESAERRDVVESLPRVMAELMLLGYTMEILDVNARQVPITFIKAVFGQLNKMITGKVFILSVLGIQSSGKSTLLNAMFGAQFPVSAGACTQGANAQLIPLPKNMKSNGYEHIMLVDTEGLRSVEHDVGNKSIDNELATLVVGIGDLTIINIKGENQAEMNDVLQIVIHALLKIRMVNNGLQLKSKCFFIHQNVEAPDAKEKLIDEKQKLAMELDNVAVDAANMAGIGGITGLSDIIDFDVKRDVRYFSNLWQGNPPMAPANTGYSEKVKELKRVIFENIIPTKKYQLDISAFSTRLEDLWEGILGEDFVFSFKNSLEMKAYTALESKFNQLKWQLNDAALCWLSDARASGLTTRSIVGRTELEGRINPEYTKVKKELEVFFMNSNESQLLEQWNSTYQKKLECLKDDIISTTIKTLNDDIDVSKRQGKYKSQLDDWKDNARKKAIELAEKKRICGEKPNKVELEEAFNELWRNLQTKIPPLNIDECNVDITVEQILMKALNMEQSLFQRRCEELKKPLKDLKECFEIEDKHITWHTSVTGRIKHCLSTNKECFHKARKITTNILEKVFGLIASITEENFSKARVEQIVKIVTEAIDNWNAKGKYFDLTQQYKVSTLVMIGRITIPYFKDMQQNFKNKIDRCDQLGSYFKRQLRIRYDDTFEQIAPEQTIASLVAQLLETLIRNNIYIFLPRCLANVIKENSGFMDSKVNFLNKMLTDMIDEDSFDGYMEYVENPRNVQLDRLKKYINNYLFNPENRFANLAIDKLLLILVEVSKCVKKLKIESELNPDDADTPEWAQSFTDAMRSTIPITMELMNDIIKDSDRKELKFEMLYKFLETSLLVVRKKLTKEYKNTTTLKPDIEKSVIQQLEGAVLGCNQTCPFCNIPCSLTETNHDTRCFSSQHYPSGIAGHKLIDQNKLAIETCNTLVDSSRKFKNDDTKRLCVPIYRKIINFFRHFNSMYQYDIVSYSEYERVYRKWNIPGDRSLEASLYWKRFIAEYGDNLAKKNGADAPDIPYIWNGITKDDAKRSLIET